MFATVLYSIKRGDVEKSLKPCLLFLKRGRYKETSATFHYLTLLETEDNIAKFSIL